MNEETNAPGTDTETEGTQNQTTATEGGAGSQTGNEDSSQTQDDYYAVDYAKKDVISTIGDGEMHDEGLVGAGEQTTDLQSSMERLTDEQDQAESHDSEQ